MLIAVKLCLFVLWRLATVGGDMAGLLGLLGVVLELLELGLVMTGDDVVVELPPDDTFVPESAIGSAAALNIDFKIKIMKVNNYVVQDVIFNL